MGRFLSADTVQPNAPGTQGYNRYAYVANNPTTWNDPTGHAVTVSVLQPVLHPAWLAIGIAFGIQYVWLACAASPLTCTSPIGQPAIFAIVVLILVACVLEVGGPCWTLQNVSFDLPSIDRPFENTRDTTQDKPLDGSQPVPTPSMDPNCIDNPWPSGGKAPEWKSDIPAVSNQKLQNHINALFKAGDQVPGGTAGAIREELRTGKPTGGKEHLEKGEGHVQGLSNLLKSGTLNAHDKAIAEWLENDLLNALSGC